MTEQWVLLWSRERNAAEVRRLDDYLSACRECYRDDLDLGDARPLFVGPREQMVQAMGAMQPTLACRDHRKAVPA